MTPTIYALSSGSPPAAIAVVRISGPRAAAALERLAGRLPGPRMATLMSLKENGTLLDRALALFFPGPGSATGEDLAELHLHGGRATVTRVIDALSRIDGLVPAEPGGFTRRAFDNGRIDLAEAEGLADLLTAETEQQRLSALAMAEGGLSAEVEGWRQRLLDLAARVEALLDFSDEDDVRHDDHLERDVERLAEDVRARLDRPAGERLRDGVRVALAGPPNSGKSSLLNVLAGRDAAITSSRAGTTRDVIEAPIALAGRPFVFLDMAGLRDEAGDEIEQIGIDRAQRAIAASDIVLWLGDDDAPAGSLWLWPRCDLPERAEAPSDRVAVSAVTGAGIVELIGLLVERADRLLPRLGELALNRRQQDCLCEAMVHIVHWDDMLVLAEHLRLARTALDRVTGRAGVEDMLDALFSRFCIGK